MRFLHTADLHLGRQFNGLSLDEDQEAILDQIFDSVLEREADVLIIAGDIFDRAAPPSSAIRLFNRFVTRIGKETNAAVVAIAGNHDSGDRIGAMAVLTDETRALVRGVIAPEEPVLIVSDEHGLVAFTALPFSYEYAARECFGDEEIATPEHVLAAQMAAARRAVPKGARWVVVAHAFVSGAQASEVERPLARVGGIETVPVEVFDGAHYVALGHLHRPQHVGAQRIRYSGSPLAFGFDEADHSKTMSLVDIDSTGAIRIEEIPFRPLRRVRVLRGKHAELISGAASTDFVKAILTDDVPLIDPMKRLWEVYPHACHLSYERSEQPAASSEVAAPIARSMTSEDVIEAFLEQITGEGMTEVEQVLVGHTLHDMQVEENAA
jgi:exonuclease SbcD